MNALRLTAGVEARIFTERTGLPLESMAVQIAAAQRQGLLETTPQRLCPTPRGARFLNTLLQIFLAR